MVFGLSILLWIVGYFVFRLLTMQLANYPIRFQLSLIVERVCADGNGA